MNQLKTPQPRQPAQIVGDPSVTRPNLSAISTQAAKDFARIDESYDDSIVQMLVDGAQRAFENFTDHLLFDSEVVATFRPEAYLTILRLPWLPLREITSIVDDDDEALDEDCYEIVGDEIYVNEVSEITLTYQAGIYETTDDNEDNVYDGPLEAELKLGMLKWIASNYNDREDVVIGHNVATMPNASRSHWIGKKRHSI